MGRPTLLILLIACGTPCPSDSRADPARAARIVARLASDPEGASLPIDATVCFSPGGPQAITPTGVAWLDERAEDDALAARLGHLLVHRVDGVGTFDVTRPCEPQVSAAVASERRATALEGRLRAKWGLEPVVGEDHVADYTRRCGSPP